MTLVRHEDDSDLHIVVRDAQGRTMITEAPLPACAPRATALRRKQIGVARAAVRVCARAVVTGVAFFDFKHGQTGVAPNAIELHKRNAGFELERLGAEPVPGVLSSPFPLGRTGDKEGTGSAFQLRRPRRGG